MKKKSKITIGTVCILLVICVGVYLNCFIRDSKVQEDIDKISENKMSCNTERGIFIGAFGVRDQKLLYYDFSVGELTYDEQELDGMKIKIVDTEMRDGPPLVSIVEINGEKIYAQAMTYNMQPSDNFTIRNEDGSYKTIATQISSRMIENGSLISYNDNWYVIYYNELTESWNIYRMKIGNLIHDIKDIYTEDANGNYIGDRPHISLSYGECLYNGSKIYWDIWGNWNSGSLHMHIEIGEENYTYFIRHDITSNLEVGLYIIYFLPEKLEICIEDNISKEIIATTTYYGD